MVPPVHGPNFDTSSASCDHDRMAVERADILAMYERYLTCCNEHRLDELGEFVSEQVSGSAPVDGLAGYVDGIRAVCTAFSDYHWDLQEVVVVVLLDLAARVPEMVV